MISTGPGSGNGESMTFRHATPDGDKVFFETNGSLDPVNDTDPNGADIYERSGSTTTLISTGTGPATATR